MATELTDLDLGEWSICIDPANEDSTIEIVKSKTGLAPDLKETDMSDKIEKNEGEGDAELEQFANEVLEEFNGLSAEEQADALVGMALENAEYEDAVEDAAEVIKSLSENVVPREKYEELKKSATLLMDRVTKSGASDEDGLLAEVRKSLAPGQELSAEAIARIEAIEKSQNEAAIEKAVTKARGYNFGKAEEVADLEMSIRKSLGDKKADAFVAIVKQAGALAKSSPLFKSVGEDAGNLDAGDPEAVLKSKVTEIRKSDSKLSEAQAVDRALEENPELYTQYMSNRRRA